jgi:threonine dehydratase
VACPDLDIDEKVWSGSPVGWVVEGRALVRKDVEIASGRIGRFVRRTPVVRVTWDSSGRPREVWFKLEHLQHTGSFKARGALNRVLGAAERGQIGPAGVVAASGGNAGVAFAYAAGKAGTTSRIFLPANAPEFKVDKLRALGADVVQVGDRYHDAYQAMLVDAERTGALIGHAYDQLEVCAGQGTVGLELVEQVPEAIDVVLVAVGGGGLMAGVAAAMEGTVRVVGVEPENCPTLNAALAAGKPVDVAVGGVAADSLGATRVGTIAWEVAQRAQVGSVTVTDEDIVRSRRRLWDGYRLVVEHGAAAAIAALWSGRYVPEDGARVVVVLCGANTSPGDLVSE